MVCNKLRSELISLLKEYCTIPPIEASELENLLNYLKLQQVDFTGYKRSTLMRRLLSRMQKIRVEHYQNYRDYLEQHPDELHHLLNTVFINFTHFFRDRPVWDYLANQLIPQIISTKRSDEPIRVWSAGCASGEETYSLAMLLAEALGLEQFQQRVRLFGTDVDQDALTQARQGYYPAHVVEAIPHSLLKQYFDSTNQGYLWRNDLRHSLIFCRHDLIQFPPFSRIDLLVCRNTLMYFTAKTQIQALVRFHFSIADSGFLLVGQAENPTVYHPSPLFTPVDRQMRVFAKVPNAHRTSRLLPMAFRCS